MPQDISIAEAQLLGLFLQSLAYGVYLVTLGVCVRALFCSHAKSRLVWLYAVAVISMCVFTTCDMARSVRLDLDAFVWHGHGEFSAFDNILDSLVLLKVSKI